jgi:hypothetical protein
MRHARPDYNRIQDPAGLIPDDEPVFLLRAQDALAAPILRQYLGRYAAQPQADPEVERLLQLQILAFDNWGRAKGTKFPDVPNAQVAAAAERDPDFREVDEAAALAAQAGDCPAQESVEGRKDLPEELRGVE